jgi:transposase
MMDGTDISRIKMFRQFKNEIRGSKRHLIVGIDIGKIKHHAFLGTANGHTVQKGLIVEHNLSGFSYLMGRTQFYMDRDGFEDVVFGLEPTSVYHKPLAEFLIEQGYLVVYVTNEAIINNRSLLDGRWDKNDTKDSANVADLVCQGKCHYYDLPDIKLRDLRNLLLLRKRLRKQRHSSKMRIRNNLVAQYFPELDKLWKTREQENLAIVRWCLSPAKIAAMKFEDFCCLVTNRNRGDRQQQRLFKIWDTASFSIGCSAGSSLELEARVLVDTVRLIKAQIAEVDEAIEAICLGFEEYQYLLSIPGFGPYVSAVVLAAIGNAYRFENAGQILRLAGFDLSAKRSGKKSATAVPVISKKGKADLRYAVYQAALIASSLTTHFAHYYPRLLEGRQREKGIRTKMRVKLAAKLLVIAWTLMKKKESFNPDYIISH